MIVFNVLLKAAICPQQLGRFGILLQRIPICLISPFLRGFYVEKISLNPTSIAYCEAEIECALEDTYRAITFD